MAFYQNNAMNISFLLLYNIYILKAIQNLLQS